jgi:hypothetical protein
MRQHADFPLQWSFAYRSACAVLLFLIALGARFAIAPLEGGLAFVTFYPVVLIGFFVLGRGPGALLAVISGLTAEYIFIPPYMGFATELSAYSTLGFYALTCTLAGWIVDALHRTAQRLRATLAELAAHGDNLERQVEQRTAELVQARDAAHQAALAKTSFLANMSHEIRTPLNAIVGLAHLVRRAGVSQAQSARLDKIDTASRHLLDMIGSILDLSKIEKGEFKLDEEVLDVRSVATDVLSMVAPVAAGKHLGLELDIATMPGDLFVGDRIRLQRALLNYCANAVRFTESGSVVVSISVVKDHPVDALIRFEVADTGIGIEGGKLTRLFNPFEQADASISRAYGGTGLGLAITRRLAHLMGGEAGADSTPGIGSTFWFTARLRKGPPSAVVAAAAGAPGSAEDALRRDYADRLVLLVEDDPVNREIALALLRSIWPAIGEACDGHEAVAAVEQRVYDLILMDVQMPGIDGLEATQCIRRMANGQQVPILALTADAFTEDRERCLEAGMNDFLTKPIDPEALYAALHMWLSKGLRASETIPIVADRTARAQG